jgi:hypothetical protein
MLVRRLQIVMYSSTPSCEPFSMLEGRLRIALYCSNCLCEPFSMLEGRFRIVPYCTIFVKKNAPCQALIWKSPKIDAIVLKVVLKCSKNELNHAM